MNNNGGLVVINSAGVQTSGAVIPKKEERKTSYSGTQADLVFVIDTTGSMDDKIAGLLATCQKFVDQLAGSQVDWQIALVAFGDLTVPGDKIVATGFGKNVATIKKVLQTIPRYAGGGNDGESSLEAVDKALGLKGYRSGAIKVFLLVTDEPALQHQFRAETITTRLRQDGVLTFVIAPDLAYFREMAMQTGGDWFLVSSQTNFLSIVKILETMMTKVSATVVAVQEEAGGDVQKFLQLRGG